MRDNPNQIADSLAEQHGIEGALKTARAGIAAAHTSGDNYGLSIWRDVRRVLTDKQDAHQDAL